jgi:hypothetical protein
VNVEAPTIEVSSKAASRAISQTLASIHNDIGAVKRMSKQAIFADLAWLLFALHIVRIRQTDAAFSLPEPIGTDYASLVLLEEGLKYAIQTVTKYGKLTKKLRDPVNYLAQRVSSLGDLVRRANLIHAKYANVSLLGLCHAYVESDSQGRASIDLNAARADPEITPLYDYFRRLEVHMEVAKQPIPSHQLVESFLASFSGLEDLFEAAFHVSTSSFALVVNHLLDSVIDAFRSRENSFPRAAEDRIDTSHPLSSIIWGESLLIPLSGIDARFGAAAAAALREFLFDKATFDPKNLDYHQVYRTPILPYDSSLIVVSPELLLDSLNSNVHYTLLEAHPKVSEQYKARASHRFVDEISQTCRDHGYEEVARDLQLVDGSTRLGDVDLVARNAKGHYLLVEAKNHSLPLSVYFKDPIATGRHLSYLRDSWEKPYLRRLAHLTQRAGDYAIPLDFSYIIVSRMPEVLSHFFGHLAITKQELAHLLPIIGTVGSFGEVYTRLYPPGDSLSDEEVANLLHDGLSVIRPA